MKRQVEIRVNLPDWMRELYNDELARRGYNFKIEDPRILEVWITLHEKEE